VNSAEFYRAALEAGARVGAAYRGGLSNDAATAARTAGAVTPRVPIYRELLAELRAALQAAASGRTRPWMPTLTPSTLPSRTRRKPSASPSRHDV
jgi:hypothetical protein